VAERERGRDGKERGRDREIDKQTQRKIDWERYMGERERGKF
jgi:hypothetical protein